VIGVEGKKGRCEVKDRGGGEEWYPLACGFWPQRW